MTFKCLNCNNIIASKKNTNQFCSKSCAATYNNKKFPKRKKIIKHCKHCEIEIFDRRTVCDNCNPSIINWSTITLQDLSKIRKYQPYSRIRSLSREWYIKSGAPQQCFICGYDKTFQVCHIKSIASFGINSKITEINSLSNLIALCPNHHWELDHGLLNVKNI
jgi:hypothetical protein